jgi:hypothetical protein
MHPDMESQMIPFHVCIRLVFRPLSLRLNPGGSQAAYACYNYKSLQFDTYLLHNERRRKILPRKEDKKSAGMVLSGEKRLFLQNI